MSQKIDSILKAKEHKIWSVTPATTVYEAIVLMAEKNIGAVLVMSGEQLVGIASERDYARKVILQDRSSKTTRIEEIMTRSLITVTPDNSIDECMRLVTKHRIRHLPVLAKGRLAGIVSIGDLVNAVIAEQAHTIDQLKTYISG
jgi:CBS domain-containing protein